MKPVATGEHPAVVAIPDVVGVVPIGVEPTVIVVVFDVEHVRIAVGIRDLCKISSIGTTP